jgi:predicted molibdopterin-dependent oxidoreductase YjgC
MIQERSRLGWRKDFNYGRRSLGQVAMMRYKTVIGHRLHAQTLPTQKVEAAAGCKVINIMTRPGIRASMRPRSELRAKVTCRYCPCGTSLQLWGSQNRSALARGTKHQGGNEWPNSTGVCWHS